MITNPARDMQVATRSAELAAEETDMSLATTLEGLRESGGGAGMATALAQQANKSKLQISGNIQQHKSRRYDYTWQEQYAAEIAMFEHDSDSQFSHIKTETTKPWYE